MAGPNIIVSGAVFVDQVIAETLTDYISVIPRMTLNKRLPIDEAGCRVARLFRALKMCITDLDMYYKEILRASPPSPPAYPVQPIVSTTDEGPFARLSAGHGWFLPAPSMIGPHFKTYRESSGHKIKLTYKKCLVRNLSYKIVFLAEANHGLETADVVVKFTPAYSREAHELLAAASPPRASKLRYCEYEPSVGMFVAVMDYVQGREADAQLTNSAHIESLRAALSMLHDRGLVFGDLRPPNILLWNDGIMLVDFDWCGKEGEARYPSNIMLEDTYGWYHQVRRGGLIQKLHDAYLFSALTRENL
jgi:hypothetical protein